MLPYGTLYVATSGGLSFSTDGGNLFTTKTTSDGLGSNYVQDMTSGPNGAIYLATYGGVSVEVN